jgi:N-(2-amino-2-carboxyethyl)-L-glutamate synthase
MAVVSVPHAFHQEDLYVDLRNVFEQSLYLKCEGFNLAGSIKLKPAIEMVEAPNATASCSRDRSSSSPLPETSGWR